mmetsp:Transcript_24192/g.55025  ORF Transcript_24192/g.55025 Transcript_24192/m.55025 type:complete len:283 (-) Transcript_24192:595-1443(-)
MLASFSSQIPRSSRHTAQPRQETHLSQQIGHGHPPPPFQKTSQNFRDHALFPKIFSPLLRPGRKKRGGPGGHEMNGHVGPNGKFETVSVHRGVSQKTQGPPPFPRRLAVGRGGAQEVRRQRNAPRVLKRSVSEGTEKMGVDGSVHGIRRTAQDRVGPGEETGGHVGKGRNAVGGGRDAQNAAADGGHDHVELGTFLPSGGAGERLLAPQSVQGQCQNGQGRLSEGFAAGGEGGEGEGNGACVRKAADEADENFVLVNDVLFFRRMRVIFLELFDDGRGIELV